MQPAVIRLFPFLGWFRNYGLQTMKVDALAGVTVALVLIPQSMAYAQLAGLPSYYGLYASLLPPIIAALFGSSRQLATGPVAVVSLMTAASLEPIATQGSGGYISYAILLALMVGGFQFLLGLLRLGVVVNFLSHPVVNGFTNAAALIIATSQLPKLFGISVDRGKHHYETVMSLLQDITALIHWPTFFIGTLAFAIMFGLKRIDGRIPNVLVAVVVTTLISWAWGFEENYEAPISSIPSLDTRKRIRDHNVIAKEIESLTNQYSRLSLNIIEEKGRQKSLTSEIIHLEHELALTALQREKLRRESRLIRKRLRAVKYTAAEDSTGNRFLYPEGEVPEGLKRDGRRWRLQVEEQPLEEGRLLFKGGIEVVGSIPRGLPRFSLPGLDGAVMLRLLPYAVIIALLGFMESISVAKAMAAKSGQRLDPNQELIGQGLANMVGSLGGSYPVAGSFSRSAVNFQAGAVSGISSVVTSLTVLAGLFLFTPLLYHLPQAVLAAVIMMAVLGLINVSGFIHAWRANWYDGALAIITFFFTLLFAPHLDRGILLGVGLSLLVFLYKSMWPRVAILSRHRDGSYHDATAFCLQRCDHIAMVRFDGPLFFANATYLDDQISKIRLSIPELKHIHIVANGIDDMDATGEEVLSLIVDRVRSAGYGISFSGMKKNVLDVMKRTYLYEKIGEKYFYPTEEVAVESIYRMTHRHTDEKECPLMTCCPTQPL